MEAEGRQLLAELDAVLRDFGEPEQWEDKILSSELQQTTRRS